MTRDEALTIIAGAGIDTAAVTDAVPDELLVALAQALQQIEQMKAEMQGAPEGGGETAAAEAARQIKAITMKYSEITNQVGRLTKQLADAEARAKKFEDLGRQREDQERVALVHKFCERMAAEGRISVADADPAGPPTNAINTLLRADHARLHKFSEGGKEVQKTDLELQMAAIEARPARKFSEKVAAGTAAAAPDFWKGVREKAAADRQARQSGPPLEERLGMRPSAGRR